MIALTGEELEQAIREAISKQGWADITVKQRYEAIAKAQLKKVVRELFEPCYGTESYFLSPKGYLRFDIKGERVKALLKEVE